MRRALFLALLFATLPLGSPRAGSGATPPWRPRGVDPTGASAGARMAAAERLRVFATRADAPAGLVRSMASFAKEEMGREWRALDARWEALALSLRNGKIGASSAREEEAALEKRSLELFDYLGPRKSTTSQKSTNRQKSTASQKSSAPVEGEPSTSEEGQLSEGQLSDDELESQLPEEPSAPHEEEGEEMREAAAYAPDHDQRDSSSRESDAERDDSSGEGEAGGLMQGADAWAILQEDWARLAHAVSDKSLSPDEAAAAERVLQWRMEAFWTLNAPDVSIAQAARERAGVMQKKCKHPDGCSRQPAFGQKKEGVPFFCKQHRPDGFVNVKSSRCAFSGCLKQPVFGFPRETGAFLAEGSIADGVARFCANHRPEGARDLKHRRCTSEDCVRQPSFAPQETRTPLRCRLHRIAGDEDVKHPDRRTKQTKPRGVSKPKALSGKPKKVPSEKRLQKSLVGNGSKNGSKAPPRTRRSPPPSHKRSKRKQGLSAG